MFGLIGATEFLILFLGIAPLSGGIPLGLPPTPEDPIMSNIAPKECVAYLTWAGSTKPNPTSKNKTERLLAEKEIQIFIKKIDQIIISAIKSEVRDENAQKAMLGGSDLIKAALFNPGAIYFGSSKEIDAGLVSNLGEHAEAAKKKIALLEALLGPQIKETTIADQKWKKLTSPDGKLNLTWGFKGKYFIFGTQESSVKGILSRWDQKPPQWLTDVRKRLPVGKTSSLLHLNIEAGLKMIPKDDIDFEVNQVLAVTGVNDLKTITSVLGFDDTGYVNRSWMEFKEKPTGIFDLLNGKPLSLKDLSTIPKDSTLATAARFDAAEVYQKIRKMVGKADEDALGEFDEAMEQIQSELGVDLNEDVFKALGDVWRVYNSPTDGGLVFTGLTGVVSVRDSKKIAKVLQKLEAYVQKQVKADLEDDGRRFRRRHSTIKNFKHEGQTIYFVNSVGFEMPFAPAWCVTDKEFIISLYPSHVKSYLSRNKASAKKSESIATVPEVAKLFAGKKGPVVMMYQDSREVFKLAYPFVQIFANIAASELQREGLDVDISMLPSSAPFLKHLGPNVSTLSYKENGIEYTSKGTAPINIGALPLVAGTFLFIAIEEGAFFLTDQIGAHPKKARRNRALKKAKVKLDSPVMLNRLKRDNYCLPKLLAN